MVAWPSSRISPRSRCSPSWDQLVMMPADGAATRAQQLGTLARLTHERATAEEIGAWLDEIDAAGEARRSTSSTATSCVWRAATGSAPAACRDELAVERARAGADGQESWRLARENDDFAAFMPALERNVELARAYAECVAEDGESRYEALLGDYRLRAAHGRAAPGVRRARAGAAAARRRGARALAARARSRCPSARSARPSRARCGGSGSTTQSWRVDVSAHPFTAWIGRGDSRVTTRYSDGDVESLLSSLHEYGHALYERQVDPALDAHQPRHAAPPCPCTSPRASCGRTTSRATPPSPRCSPPSWAPAASPSSAAELHATLVGVEPSLIRVSADPLTYPLHIVLRFELELALIDGDLAVADLPAAWREGMQPPARRRGPLRRARLPAGRALGRRQLRLLPQLRARLPDRRAAVGGAGARARPARGGSAPRRGRRDPALARRARAPPRAAPGHDAARRARDRARRSRSSRSCGTCAARGR